MFVETIKSDGLAHLSYLIGNAGQAAVIDPRRDCEIYAQRAAARGCRISHIFETHRNEDLVSGAPTLAQLTGAPVHHGPNAAGRVAYARTVREGARFDLGALRIVVLETPGHTDDSLSFVLYDDEFGDEAVAVFTGDALFVGDVGRTDFYPERAAEVAGLLFDSLRKLCALGDQTILHPAHGAGSVCGNSMADREFSTIGYERRNNPMLQIARRDDFIARKLAERHEQPPYFRLMEQLNLQGGAPAARLLTPPPLEMATFCEVAEDAVLVDVRGIAAFLGAHLPGSLAIPTDMLPAFAGWLLDPDRAVALVAQDDGQAACAARHLARIGYDRVAGFLKPALTGWAAAGRPFRALEAVDHETVAARVARPAEDWTLLDVRSPSETEEGVIDGARRLYVGELPGQLEELDREGRYTVMCASGARATIAASILRRADFRRVDVFLGSMGAWKAAGGKTVKPAFADEVPPRRTAQAGG